MYMKVRMNLHLDRTLPLSGVSVYGYHCCTELMGHARCNIIYSLSLLVRVRYIVKYVLCPLFYVSRVNKLYYTGDEPK